MYLEAVTVCINYSDFLRETIPFNKQLFDNWVIVTSKNDFATQDLCIEYKIRYITSERGFVPNGFNKGKFINDGLSVLQKKDWIVHLDADMALYSDTRKKLEQMKLEQDTFYGIARIMCPNFEQWDHFKKTNEQKTRWSRQGRSINIGVGFFQLFHSAAPCLINDPTWYPEQFNTAGRSDRFFYRKWSKRTKIRSMVGMHLEQGYAPMGTNWLGRKAATFPSVDTSV